MYTQYTLCAFCLSFVFTYVGGALPENITNTKYSGKQKGLKMITMKNLNERLKKIENNLIERIKDCDFIVRKEIWIDSDTYKEEVDNLLRAGFEKTQLKEKCGWLTTNKYEIYEKNYATGEY